MLGRLSLKTKLTGLVITIITVSSSIFGRFMYNGLVELLDSVLGSRAETVAETLHTFVDPQWVTSWTPSMSKNPQDQLLEVSTRLIKKGYVQRVELIRYVDQNTVEHVLSLPEDQSPDYAAPGKREDIKPGGLYSKNKTGHHAVDLSTGASMAGWTELFQGDKSLGLLIVYIDGRHTAAFVDSVSLAILATMVGFIVLSGLTAYKFSASFEKTAVTDGLMGIYNHKYFKQRLEQEVAKARRYGQPTSLALFDIDFFKRVNDTYGHQTGDIVLKNMARLVNETARNTDVVARYGGEEIAVILTHTGLAGAQEFAERLRIKVSHFVHRDPEEKAEFRCTISVGVAQVEQGVTMMDLIKRADAALYHSKRTGRNRVTIYQEDILMPPEEFQTKPHAKAK